MSDEPRTDPTDRQLHISVVTGDRVLFEGAAIELRAPAVRGMVTIRRNHAPMLAMLQPGELDIVRKGTVDTWAVGGGFVEVLDNQVVVLADTAERAEEIDVRRAEEALERAKALARRHEQRADLAAAHDLALRRSRARISVARKALQRQR